MSFFVECIKVDNSSYEWFYHPVAAENKLKEARRQLVFWRSHHRTELIISYIKAILSLYHPSMNNGLVIVLPRLWLLPCLQSTHNAIHCYSDRV